MKLFSVPVIFQCERVIPIPRYIQTNMLNYHALSQCKQENQLYESFPTWKCTHTQINIYILPLITFVLDNFHLVVKQILYIVCANYQDSEGCPCLKAHFIHAIAASAENIYSKMSPGSYRVLFTLLRSMLVLERWKELNSVDSQYYFLEKEVQEFYFFCTHRLIINNIPMYMHACTVIFARLPSTVVI